MTVREYLNWRKAIRLEPTPQQRMTPEDRKLWLLRVRRANRAAQERRKTRSAQEAHA